MCDCFVLWDFLPGKLITVDKLLCASRVMFILVWPTQLDPALRTLFVCVCVCVCVCARACVRVCMYVCVFLCVHVTS